jgi:DNA-directed RNA polymerase subunit N (RpoN/RPB10)
MLYYKCPTCRTVLANRQLPYEEGLQKICENEKLDKNKKDKEKMKLLDDLLISNICCRTRILTYLQIIDTVI